MALITVQQFRDSLEARQYDLGAVASVDIEAALTASQNRIEAKLGHSLTVYAAGTAKRGVAEEALRLLAAAVLVQVSARSRAGVRNAPPGALLTSYSSENAQFTFFTPESELGHPEVERLLNLLEDGASDGGGLVSVRVQSDATAPRTPDVEPL